MKHATTKGPNQHLSLKELSDAYDELMGLRKQVGFLESLRADLETKYFDSQKKLREARVALTKVERERPFNENDEDLLFEDQVEFAFERPFTGGKRLIAKSGGRRICTIRRESEGQSLVGEALRKIRAAIRRG